MCECTHGKPGCTYGAILVCDGDIVTACCCIFVCWISASHNWFTVYYMVASQSQSSHCL